MSLTSKGLPAFPEETVRLAHIVCPKGDLCLWIGDELSEVFQDQLFASLFPRRGQPTKASWRLALVTIHHDVVDDMQPFGLETLSSIGC